MEAGDRWGVPWQPDDEAVLCPLCGAAFTLFTRKHHCRFCGLIVCDDCCTARVEHPKSQTIERICDQCYVGAEPAEESVDPPELDPALQEDLERMRMDEDLERMEMEFGKPKHFVVLADTPYSQSDHLATNRTSGDGPRQTVSLMVAQQSARTEQRHAGAIVRALEVQQTGAGEVWVRDAVGWMCTTITGDRILVEVRQEWNSRLEHAPGLDLPPSYELAASPTPVQISGSPKRGNEEGCLEDVMLLFVVVVKEGVAYRTEPDFGSVFLGRDGPDFGDVVVARGTKLADGTLWVFDDIGWLPVTKGGRQLLQRTNGCGLTGLERPAALRMSEEITVRETFWEKRDGVVHYGFDICVMGSAHEFHQRFSEFERVYLAHASWQHIAFPPTKGMLGWLQPKSDSDIDERHFQLLSWLEEVLTVEGVGRDQQLQDLMMLTPDISDLLILYEDRHESLKSSEVRWMFDTAQSAPNPQYDSPSHWEATGTAISCTTADKECFFAITRNDAMQWSIANMDLKVHFMCRADTECVTILQPHQHTALDICHVLRDANGEYSVEFEPQSSWDEDDDEAVSQGVRYNVDTSQEDESSLLGFKSGDSKLEFKINSGPRVRATVKVSRTSGLVEVQIEAGQDVVMMLAIATCFKHFVLASQSVAIQKSVRRTTQMSFTNTM